MTDWIEDLDDDEWEALLRATTQETGFGRELRPRLAAVDNAACHKGLIRGAKVG